MKNKILLSIGTTAAIVAPSIAVLSCSLFKNQSGGNYKSDLSFWNYEDYMDDNAKAQINQIYDYHEFKDLPELEVQLKQGTTAGGVGSDYFIAALANKGLITKIDFSQIFTFLSPDRSTWANDLKNLYTDVTWNILKTHKLTKTDARGNVVKDDNNKIIHDVDGDGTDDYLWEYMIPYFAQNKVIGITAGARLDKIYNNGNGTMPLRIYQILKGTDQDVIDKLFSSDKSYLGILKQLKTWGFDTISINDYMRDNMIIGSEYQTSPLSATGIVKDNSTATKQLSNFKTILNKAGFSGKKVIFESSGVKNFEHILDKKNNQMADRDIALLYNGDAFDAYDGTETSKPNSIRIIVPHNSSFLLDGIVMSATIKDDFFEKARFYQVVRNTLFVGTKTAHTFSGYAGYWNKLYQNWSFVGYTPAYKELNAYAKQTTDDPVAKYFLGATAKANTNNNASTNTLAQVISSSRMTHSIQEYDDVKRKI